MLQALRRSHSGRGGGGCSEGKKFSSATEGGTVDQDVIKAKRIELLDAPGRPSLVLRGRDEVGRAGLVVSSFEETSEVGASAVISFIEGRVLLSLRNADGSELTLTP